MTPLKEKTDIYYESPSEADTDTTFLHAKERAQSLGIREVVVASTTGRTGAKACQIFKGFKLVVVRHHTGFRTPGAQQMTPEHEKAILTSGARIVTAGHAFSGVERSMRTKRNTIGPLELMADTLRVFGEGTKVCLEITVMAADAGELSMDRPIVAIAGTSEGADTALVIRPTHSNNFFDLFVKEIITKPSEPAKA
jgi:hypothetical protein